MYGEKLIENCGLSLVLNKVISGGKTIFNKAIFDCRNPDSFSRQRENSLRNLRQQCIPV